MGGGASRFFSGVGNGFKSFGEGVYGGVLKPIGGAFTGAANGIASGASNILNTGLGAVTTTVGTLNQGAGEIFHSGAGAITGVGQGAQGLLNAGGSLLSSPLLIIGAVVVGVIVLPKLLNSGRSAPG